MKPRNINAIRELVGGNISGHPDSYSPTFHDGQTPPSKSEIDTKLATMISDFDAQEYVRNRASAYDSIGNQLDLLFHDMTAGKGSKTGEWYKAIAKVKADNPKG